MQLPIKYKLYNNKLWVRYGLEDVWKEAQWNVKSSSYIPITQEFGANFTWTNTKVHSEWYNRKFYGDIIPDIIGHNGIDFLAPTGTRLYAPEDMKITTLLTSDGYGIKSKSANGQHRFLHLKEFHCSVGQELKKGDFFAISNNTGLYTTAPHLHWDFQPLNPDKKNGFSGAINHRGFIENLTVYKLPYNDGQCLIRTEANGEFYVVDGGDLVYVSSEKIHNGTNVIDKNKPQWKQRINNHIPIVTFFLEQRDKGLPVGFIKSIKEEEFNIFNNLIQ